MDRALRARPVEGPFALALRSGPAERLHDLTAAAEAQGLARGMALAEARALCPGLVVHPADPAGDARFLRGLARWLGRFSPRVALDGPDGLLLDLTGVAHLWGGEADWLTELRRALSRAGLGARLGLADTPGAAWALAHSGEGVAAPGATRAALAPLPVTALRLPPATTIPLQRLGLRQISDLLALPRAALGRRFGPEVGLALDRALGLLPEALAPLPEPPRFALRLTLPEPIGRVEDVMAGADRLLRPLCDRLAAAEAGARHLTLTLRRVDAAEHQVALRLAAPLRDPRRILPLFLRGIEAADAGFGIDQLRLAATGVEPLPATQLATRAAGTTPPEGALDDLITRLGTRIGLENIRRALPAESHIPARSFLIAPAALVPPAPRTGWAVARPRPVTLFAPEPVAAPARPAPPRNFRWRRRAFTTARATGPERIAPEWWLGEESWRGGLRDYWRIDTTTGPRLWLFFTPEAPGWFAEGEFA
ncbi:protein ImuB [Rhodobacter viridis]|uniref:DNA-directed DNA polymerase n=1 Tax=Rhodobacter viridis TaxID=1054202 RepID=A0A318TTD6_9RHOB|nr:protein ImuB [Rhodobacter viridis]